MIMDGNGWYGIGWLYQAKSSIYKKCAPVRRGRRLQEGIEGVGGVNSLDFI